MKVFFCQIVYTYTADSFLFYLKKEGHNVTTKLYSTPEDIYKDERTIESIARDIKKGDYDCVVSINYYPVIAYACDICNTTYIAWSYDSPIDISDKSSLKLKTNRVFLYDRIECDNLRRAGYANIFHMPLAADLRMMKRVSGIKKNKDFSLVGKLYESTYPALRTAMGEYMRGYLDSVIEAQRLLYGCYIIPELVGEHQVEQINNDFISNMKDPIEATPEQMWYSLASQVTHSDRFMMLRLLSRLGDVHFYTYDLEKSDVNLLDGINIHHEINYKTEMPRVFASTRINLHPGFRAIASGISLRVLDVISCGAFVLANYQPELVEFFVPGEEIVCYESIEDAYEKATFFLKNESERERIVKNGIKRLKTDFTYEDRILRMFDTV